MDLDSETAMQRLFQLFSQYGGAFDQSENLYFQELDMKPLYDRWVQYQAELKAAERLPDESDRINAAQTAGEKFNQWMDTYS